MNTYKGWCLLEEMPEGWTIDKTAGSPLHGYEFVTNGKSVISGQQERALLLINPSTIEALVGSQPVTATQKTERVEPKQSGQVIDGDYRRTVNDLARQCFKQQILNDILVDLTICEIEGWCKLEYIDELKKLIGGLGRKKALTHKYN